MAIPVFAPPLNSKIAIYGWSIGTPGDVHQALGMINFAGTAGSLSSALIEHMSPTEPSATGDSGSSASDQGTSDRQKSGGCRAGGSPLNEASADSGC